MPSCWHICVANSSSDMHLCHYNSPHLFTRNMSAWLYMGLNACSFLTTLFQVGLTHNLTCYLVQLHPFVHHLLDFGAEVRLLNTIHSPLLQHRCLVCSDRWRQRWRKYGRWVRVRVQVVTVQRSRVKLQVVNWSRKITVPSRACSVTTHPPFDS